METLVQVVVMIGAFCFGAAVGMGLRKHKDRVIFGRKKPDNNAPAGLIRDLIRCFLAPLTCGIPRRHTDTCSIHTATDA